MIAGGALLILCLISDASWTRLSVPSGLSSGLGTENRVKMNLRTIVYVTFGNIFFAKGNISAVYRKHDF